MQLFIERFSVSAYSSAGARGLMQLGKVFTQKKLLEIYLLQLVYSKRRLTTNPQYNILLGTTY